MTTREYSSTSVETTLASGMSSTQTTMTVAAGTAAALLGGVALSPLGTDQFTVAIDPDTQNEEIVFITNVDGSTFQVTRGGAGSSNISHSGGATVRHVLTSDDLNFFKTAIQPDVFTVKGQLITATGPGVSTVLSPGTNGQILSADSTDPKGIKWVAAPTGNVTLDGVQTLTNKDLSSATNTFPSTLATLDGTQTLTNKTLTAPKIDLLIQTLPSTTTTYYVSAPLGGGDDGQLIATTAATLVTIYIPSGYAQGAQINFLQNGNGQAQINPGAGVSISSVAGGTPSTRTRYSAMTAIHLGSDSWVVVGDII